MSNDKKLNLILHCGGQETELSKVRNVITPPADGSHYPVAHDFLIDRVVDTFKKSGLMIKQMVHGLWNGKLNDEVIDGARYFGMMEFEGASDAEYSLIAGLRNSHDKKFASAIVLGSGVFVCDNLAFSGEVKLARRHTKNISAELPSVIGRAIERLHILRGAQEKRIEAYHNTPINDNDTAKLILEIARSGDVIGTTKILPVWQQWLKTGDDKELFEGSFYERTVWSLFNAFTEIFKPKPRVIDGTVQRQNQNQGLMELPKKSTLLHGAMDQACGLDLNVLRDETLG